MSTYSLIAIRYTKPGEDIIFRSEFHPVTEKERAIAFQAEKVAEGYTIISGIDNMVEIEHGGGQITPNKEI